MAGPEEKVSDSPVPPHAALPQIFKRQALIQAAGILDLESIREQMEVGVRRIIGVVAMHDGVDDGFAYRHKGVLIDLTVTRLVADSVAHADVAFREFQGPLDHLEGIAADILAIHDIEPVGALVADTGHVAFLKEALRISGEEEDTGLAHLHPLRPKAGTIQAL